jgi:hypothetical protein
MLLLQLNYYRIKSLFDLGYICAADSDSHKWYNDAIGQCNS